MGLDRHALDLWALSCDERRVEPLAWEHETRWLGTVSHIEGPPEPSKDALVATDERARTRERARANVHARDLRKTLDAIGWFLSSSLAWREQRPALWQRVLDGPALNAFTHLAIRLRDFDDLDRRLEDGQGPKRKLRVCNLSRVVFRSQGRWTHPAIPKDVDRRARALPHHTNALAGPFIQASDPLAPYVWQMRYTTACEVCNELFSTRDASTKLCSGCGDGASRTRRSRATPRATSDPKPRPPRS
jgi:hypothetical protein